MTQLNQSKKSKRQQEKTTDLQGQSTQYSTRSPLPCPECGRMSQQNTYPFCSSRCKVIDLNRWLAGAYILPPPPQRADEEE
ncbi:zinc-binding protein [Bartonella australis AUST/NH1]|uniref:DNA gyrase inhibitor YacG n=1 Tax=Bartonella australis (strain Aust/NH1) TaxID=1094489 RepID=M1P542_BARAA|nr:DNA gyrase inhibitor YacG [Bartonella australis]AGF74965.1 zinc-binding protein [Bartonella australis AUST/NH1]